MHNNDFTFPIWTPSYFIETNKPFLPEIRGALVMVTHDRYLLDRVSTTVIGLDGLGNAGSFADYLQWESWQEERQRGSKTILKTGDREGRNMKMRMELVS